MTIILRKERAQQKRSSFANKKRRKGQIENRTNKTGSYLKKSKKLFLLAFIINRAKR